MHKKPFRNFSLPTIGFLLAAATLMLAWSQPAQAQTTSVTDGSTPSALKPGAPAGSYALTNFENINLFNGNLNFALPLLQVSGRGGAGVPMVLSIEQHWRLRKPKPVQNCELTGTCDLRVPWPASWASMLPDYGPGVLQGRKPGVQCGELSLTRLTFTGPGGTEFELRDQLTNGQPLGFSCNPSQGASRGTVFVTADGSAATFISDTAIVDNASQNSTVISPSGDLMLRDGTRYRIDEGKVTWLRDRNGNKLTFTYSGSKVTLITDSLNRQISIAYNVADVAPYGTSDQITFKGFGGALRTIRVAKTTLANALRTTQAGDATAPKTFQQLFPELNGSSVSQHNPTVISALWLPDGQRRYRFFYNAYSELARLELPTGGAIEYDFANATNPWDGIYRRVTERRVYRDGSTLEGKTTYSDGIATTVTVDSRNANGTLLARSKHYFYGSPFNSLNQFPTQYSQWSEGREYKTELFDSNGTTLLRRTTTTWQQRAAVAWWTGNPDAAPPNDPRVTEIVTTLADTNQVSKQAFSYDDTAPFNNRADVLEYDFGSGAPGPLLRKTHTDYLKTNAVNGLNYTSAGIHLRSLPTQIQVFDAAGVEKARTTFQYDDYTGAGSHALEPRENISGLDAGFTPSYVTRGNVTRATSWILSSGTPLHMYNHYDVAGNVMETIDARGNATLFDFADHFGVPDAEARGNAAPPELAGQTSYAFATKVTNALGHVMYVQFDYSLGSSVNGEDANGIVASGSYNDSLDRPTQIKRAVGMGAENQTTFEYDDVNRIVTSKSDRETNGDNGLVSKVVYDSLGRSTETRQYEGGTNYIAVQTEYDDLGRAYRTSNPFRPWQSQSAVWTTTVFDGLSRVRSVTTPDSAAVSTIYNGNSLTVTDQAGKARKSVTDGLGRMIEVYEDPSGLNYQTSYSYDVLDNLVKVTQGSQQRFFMYDSLKRLIRADNPEQETLSALSLSDPVTNHSAWSVKYDYDNNGNLIAKTDARGVVTANSYDALNRVTTVLYRINGQPDPNTGDVEYLYDNATNGKGRLWLTYRWGAKPSQTAVGQYDALGRVKQSYNLFGDGQGGWSAGYEVSRAYNAAGQITAETYPSGRTVSYAYDSAGRTSNVSGNLGDGVTRTYASTFVYNARSQVTQELFGTATPLYHKLQYNIRGQLWDVRVSTGSDVNGSMNRGGLQYFYDSSLGYGASGPDNNGNVRFANTYTPEDEQGVLWAIHRQSYGYDSLNRLKSVTEYFVNYNHPESQQSVQTYDYDRWGNRTINTGQTAGTGINNKAFEVETARNRLYSPGDLVVPDNQRRITYDKAGNQIKDTYTGYGTATYDGDNRIFAIQDKFANSSTYTYDANGQRVRRRSNNVETWQIYGIDGELVAEYAANAAVSTPQKEYGYRDGQLLITAEPAARQNVSWTNAVGVAVNGNSLTKTAGTFWGNAGASSTQSITSGDGYVEVTATETTTARLFGFSHTDANQNWSSLDFGLDLDVNGTIYIFEAGNNRGTFGTYATGDKLQVALDGGVVKYKKNGTVLYTSSLTPVYPLLVDTALYQTGTTVSNVVLGSGGAKVQWLVPDHLGTPRITLDQTGSLANLKRHDYLPFGEELPAGTGGRTAAMGYAAGDGVRQQFTAYERDVETGLDYAVNRYYFASQGRFSGSDPYIIVVEKEKGRDDKERSQILLNYCLQPQIWNKYTYSLNNPLRYVDPDGRRPLTEVDLARIERLNQEYDKATQAGDLDLANAISQAVNEIVTAIDAVPEGQEDPSNLKTVFFAIDQLGNKSFATNESNTFSMNGWRVALAPGDNKCNFFVAMSWALGGGIGLNGDGNTTGVPVYGTKGGLGSLWGNGYVPGANEWSGGRVQNFTRVTTPQLGDVAAWGAKGQGHSAIYAGGGAVIYAHIFEGVKIQSVQFVNSRQNTQAAFNRYKP